MDYSNMRFRQLLNLVNHKIAYISKVASQLLHLVNWQSTNNITGDTTMSYSGNRFHISAYTLPLRTKLPQIC